MRPRQATPKGFQQARPERSAFGGGTILNWSGRLPDIDHLDDASGRETVEVGQWDDTLSELREDPDVDEAIEAIDSDPPPGPFVRSTPPSAPPSDETVKGADPAEGAVVPDYVEPPEVDPPPLTYEQVFESEEGARIRAPRAVGGTSMVVAADPKPNVLPWAVLLLALVLGVSAVAFVVSQRRATDVMPASAPVAVSEPTAAPVSTAAPTPVSATAPAAAKSSPAAEEAATVEPAVENADAIYPETGAIDTYAAQLELARRLKRGSRAVKAYRRAIALNPDGAEALAELGRLMLARQHTREAAELAERATAIDPTNSLAWVTLGAARQMRGDRQGARQAYQSCAKLGKGRYVSECRAMLR